VVGAGPGGSPMVRIFSKRGKLLTPGFYAYQKSDRSGVFVSTTDLNADGKAEILTNSYSIFNFF
ncbi:MAG TPA: hypothetical protein VJB65_02820, partial [Patescibacteria group bacterium]|nr:hypothetical protein [Patescibacteria group bacterium]